MYVKVVAIQAAMQFVIILKMAEFATGFFLKLQPPLVEKLDDFKKNKKGVDC